MCIVPRSRAETSIGMLTGQNKDEYFLSGQRIRMTQQVERRQTPIQAAETQMLGMPVLQIVLVLPGRSTPHAV